MRELGQGLKGSSHRIRDVARRHGVSLRAGYPMTEVFVDTWAWYALSDRNDRDHDPRNHPVFSIYSLRSTMLEG